MRCSQILVRGDDGARPIEAIDDVGWRRRELPGHRQKIGKSAALTDSTRAAGVLDRGRRRQFSF